MPRQITGLGLVSLAVAISCATGLPARADYPVAPDVVVFCEPTLQQAMLDTAALFRSRTGVKVRIFSSPTPALLQQIAHHARDDVLIGEGGANAADAVSQQVIKPDTLHDLGRNQLVVAALAGAAGKLTAIAGKEPVAIVDPWAAIAGADTHQALQSLGLWLAVSGKSQGVVATADAAFLLTHDKVALAVVYATDVVADPRLSIAERLPAKSYPPIEYWVAETQHALSPNAGKFIALLQTAEAQQRLHADGLETSP